MLLVGGSAGADCVCNADKGKAFCWPDIYIDIVAFCNYGGSSTGEEQEAGKKVLKYLLNSRCIC